MALLTIDLLGDLLLPPGSKSTPWSPSAMLFCGVFIVMLVTLMLVRAGRAKILAAKLGPLGFRFRAVATAEDERLLDGFILGPLYARGWRKAIFNVADAPASDDGAAVIFDAKFRVDVVPGEKAFGVVAYWFTAVRLSHPGIRPPVFLLTPRADGDRLKALFAEGEITFPDDPEFTRQFRLQGHDVAAIRAFFTAERRAALRQFAPRIDLEGRDGHLLHRSSLALSTGQWPEFVQRTRQLARIFRD